MKQRLGIDWATQKIEATLDRLCDQGIMMRDGDAFLSLALPPGASTAVRLNTSNNGITLHLPGTVNARLAARTNNGSITSDFDLRMHGEFDRHHMDGVIGDGGPLIDLSTSNGNIRLLKM